MPFECICGCSHWFTYLTNNNSQKYLSFEFQRKNKNNNSRKICRKPSDSLEKLCNACDELKWPIGAIWVKWQWQWQWQRHQQMSKFFPYCGLLFSFFLYLCSAYFILFWIFFFCFSRHLWCTACLMHTKCHHCYFLKIEYYHCVSFGCLWWWKSLFRIFAVCYLDRMVLHRVWCVPRTKGNFTELLI